MKNRFLVAAIAATIAVVVSLVAGTQAIPMPGIIPELLRWVETI